MAPKEPEENRRNQDSLSEEMGIDKLADKTQDFLDINEAEDDQGTPDSGANKDFLDRPFQPPPDGEEGDVPKADKIAKDHKTGEVRYIRNTGKNY